MDGRYRWWEMEGSTAVPTGQVHVHVSFKRLLAQQEKLLVPDYWMGLFRALDWNKPEKWQQRTWKVIVLFARYIISKLFIATPL